VAHSKIFSEGRIKRPDSLRLCSSLVKLPGSSVKKLSKDQIKEVLGKF
jgi:hypothetical protein